MCLQYRHLQRLTHRGIYVTTCKIVLLLFCIWTSNVSLSAYKMFILKSYTVPVHLHNITNILNQKAFSSKYMSFFYCENMTSFLNFVTATLRTFFAWRSSILFCFLLLNWCWMASRINFYTWRVTFNYFFRTNDPLDIKNYIGRHNMVFK